MDVDVFPNTLDYWGPNGMLFFRNVQVFWMPFKTAISNARDRDRGAGRQRRRGRLRDRVELQNVKARFPIAGLHGPLPLRRQEMGPRAGRRHRSATSATTTCSDRPVRPERQRLGLGHQRQLERQGSDRTTRCACRSSTARASRTTSTTRRSTWPQEQSSATRSRPSSARRSGFRHRRLPRSQLEREVLDADRLLARGHHNSDGQTPNAYKSGQYASVNLLLTPAKNAMMGGEFQWAHRENNSDGFSSTTTGCSSRSNTASRRQDRRLVMMHDQERLGMVAACVARVGGPGR